SASNSVNKRVTSNNKNIDIAAEETLPNKFQINIIFGDTILLFTLSSPCLSSVIPNFLIEISLSS
ncbi:TPA: hypothetical protein ACIRIN_001884, partial [Streptococcus suis]